VASVSRSCFMHALDPLKHKAFLAVVRAQKRDDDTTPFPLARVHEKSDWSLQFPLPRVAEALAGQGLSLSREALVCLRDALRRQAVTAWRVAGQMLLARVGHRLEALAVPDDEGGEWPVEAAVWSSRITTGDVRMALTLAQHWETPKVEVGEKEGKPEGGMLADDPWWRALMKGLAREAGVVDFDDGALRLMLQEWERGLGAVAATGAKQGQGPGPSQPTAETAAALEEEEDELTPRCLTAWPMWEGIYTPPSPPWPEVKPMVTYALEKTRCRYCDYDKPSAVRFMRCLSQVGGARARCVVCDSIRLKESCA
jgi:hypothetical protein